jgi:hypothetical protein
MAKSQNCREFGSGQEVRYLFGHGKKSAIIRSCYEIRYYLFMMRSPLLFGHDESPPLFDHGKKSPIVWSWK